jgi:cytochrome c1
MRRPSLEKAALWSGAAAIAGAALAFTFAAGRWAQNEILARAPPPARDEAARLPRHAPTGRMTLVVAVLLAIGVLAGVGWRMWDAARERTERAMLLTGGDPAQAPAPVRRFGCAECHVVPGVAGASGRQGPPLQDVGSRVWLGGVLPNSPENLVRWIQDPRAISPRTAMPRTGISEQEARDVAAYLLQQ